MPSFLTCQVARLGALDYLHAWGLQSKLAQEVREGKRPNTLLLLEHPPVYTMGRLSRPEHLLLSSQELQNRGIAVHETDRGGQVTYHGPGQMVGYPVLDLREWGGPLKYVRRLEQIISNTLSDFQIVPELVEGITGVWSEGAKIAAIGLKISRGVSYHGFGVNVNTDLSYYDNIVPCGIEDRPVTSMSRLLGQSVDMDEVQYGLVYHFGRGMGFKMEEVELDAGALQPQQAGGVAAHDV